MRANFITALSFVAAACASGAPEPIAVPAAETPKTSGTAFDLLDGTPEVGHVFAPTEAIPDVVVSRADGRSRWKRGDLCDVSAADTRLLVLRSGADGFLLRVEGANYLNRDACTAGTEFSVPRSVIESMVNDPRMDGLRRRRAEREQYVRDGLDRSDRLGEPNTP